MGHQNHAYRVQHIVHCLAQQLRGDILAIQVWGASTGAQAQPTPGLQRQQVTFFPIQQYSCLLDHSLHQYFVSSQQYGIHADELGVIDKVWSRGVLQVMQRLEGLSRQTHPRSKLTDELLARIGEVIYIPIFDLLLSSPRVVCVLEVLVSAKCVESMIVAQVISTTSAILQQLQLAMSLQQQQPLALASITQTGSGGSMGSPKNPSSATPLQRASMSKSCSMHSLQLPITQ